MVEPDKRDLNKTADLEDTVRNLREENAKLLQLLRSQGFLLDTSNGQSSDSISSTSNAHTDTTNLTFDHSDVTLTTNSINTTNQISHQHINNHGSTNQQNYNEQIIHGNQSNITPNFNTVIQSTTQPFVQNNSNTLVQNNTNLIQPINLVNFNNVSLDSIQSFFASQNSVVYLSQASATATTTTTTTTTSSSSSSSNFNLHESLPSNTHSILPPPPPPPPPPSLPEHQISIRPKPSLLHQHQELVPVIPKMKTEHYESLTRQLSSTTNDTTNLLDNDSNDPKQKHPRPIRPRPSLRGHSLQNYKSMAGNKTRAPSFANKSSSKVPLFSSPAYPSPTTNYLSQSSIEIDHPSQLIHSKSLDLSGSSTSENKKSNKNRLRNRKKPSTSSVIVPSNNQTLVSIAPNLGRPLAPAPSNAQRAVTSNNPITKRSNKKAVKRNSKSLVQYHSESILQQNPSSPSNSFAESISGLLENFDQELIASNFLSQATVATTPTTTTTSNLLSEETNSIISSRTNIIQTLENIDHDVIQRQESYHSTIASMPTLDEFNSRLETEAILNHQTTQDYNVENEQITSFMSEEDMRLVEMNFDENTFLKQFDLEDPGIKLSVHSDQNLFASILTTNHDLIQTQQQPPQINEQSTLAQNSSLPLPPPPPMYPGSSLINNNVFTTVVPLGLQRQTSQTKTFITNNNNNTTRLLPEEGVQLTARHIEPSQVATYESVKYQDILDDLVMVTDQDALRHAQAAAAGDSSVVTTDFSFALLEATNEMIKNTNIEIVEGNSSGFTEIQYFYPMEHEQELLQKQLENCQDKQQDILHDQQPIVILERLQSQIIASVDLTKNVLNESVINTSIADLSSILQFQSIQSPSPHDTSTTELVTPIRPTKPKSPDFSSLLPSSNLYDNDPVLTYSPISDTLALSSSSLVQQLRPTETTGSPKPCILFEPISSSSNPSSPLKSSQNEMIIDSGRLDDLHPVKSDLINNDEEIEELLRDTTTKQYEIIENQGQTLMKNDVIIDDVDQLIDQIEPSEIDPKRTELLEQTFSRYQEKYQLNLQRQHELSSIKSQEQSQIIPPVKLKLNSIYSDKNSTKKKKRKSSSLTPKDQIDDKRSPAELRERPPLKITIRTKIPTAISSSDETIQNKNIRKKKKKRSHHHHHYQSDHNNNNNHHHHQKKAKTIVDRLETEYAGLTRFEQPLAQLYHRQSPPTPDEILLKDDNHSLSVPPPLSQSESQSTSATLHSGFIIDEQTPPSSITSNEHKQSPPPLLITQTKNEKLKINYSHLFDYDNNHEHQNNDTYITPPPEIDLNPQQKANSYENFCSLSNSPNKKKHHHRKSSIASSSSSKSLTNTDYAIDSQALEPVSPTPIPTTKHKHSQNPSTSSASYNDTSPPYFEHQQQKQMRDYYSRKSSSVSSSSSSSNRSSRTTPSQIYSQSRSLSNHSYRKSQEPPPLLPPVLPPPPPPMHLDPYAQPYHHAFAPQAVPPPFFNFPFPHPFLNAHPTPASAPAHFHHHPMKYHHHHHHPSHGYPTHQQQYSYHPHLQRQQQYNNSNYMSSRDHHSFDR